MLQGISFRLMNKPNIPTREDNNGHASVIDLVFTNGAASEPGSLSNIYIDTEIGCLSDHHTLTFTIGPTQEETPTPLDNGLNWKLADEETFCKALREEIELNHAEHSALVRDLLNLNRKNASEMELDGAIKIIQNYLEQVAERTVPAQQLVDQLKPWWTKELTMAYRDLRDTREVLRGWMREFHWPSLFLTELVA